MIEAPVEELQDRPTANLLANLLGDQQILCTSPASFGERHGALAVLGAGHSPDEPGEVAVTDRGLLFVGRDGGRLTIGDEDVLDRRLAPAAGGRQDLWVRTRAGTAVLRGVSAELEQAIAAKPAADAAFAPTAPVTPALLPWTEGLLPAGVAVVAAVGWSLALAQVDPDRIDDFGLVSALPVPAFLALGAICLSFAVAVTRPVMRTPVLALHVVALVFMLHGAPTVLEHVTSFAITWRHAGVTNYILEHGSVDPSINAYFNWPGFFALAALATKVTGVESPVELARWAPLVFNLLYLAPLLVIVRAATDDPRLPWAAAWTFVLANWVHQDYFSPQGLVFLLYLTVAAIALRWLRDRARTPQRAGLLVVCFVLLLAAVPSHQLTPFAMLGSLLVLVLVGTCTARLLPAIAAVLIVAWVVFAAGPYLSGHLSTLKGDVGKVGATASSNVGGRVKGSEAHRKVTYSRIATAALIWSLAAVAAVRLLRRRQRTWLPLAALAAAPFALVALQAYGGEILLRVYLLSLPFAGALAASLLFQRRDGWSMPSMPAVAAVSLLLVSGFLFTRYGNERVDLFTTAEVQATERLESTAPRGSMLVAPSANLPWQTRIGDYRYRTLDRELSARNRGRLIPAVARAMQHPKAKASYLVITRNTREYERMFGTAPWGTINDLEREVRASPRFKQVYANRDAQIFALGPRAKAAQ
jgi:hypothetical protein